MTAWNKQQDKTALTHSIADTLSYTPAETIEPVFKVVAQLRVLRSYYTSQLEHELIEDSVYYQTLNSPQRKIMDALKAQEGLLLRRIKPHPILGEGEGFSSKLPVQRF